MTLAHELTGSNVSAEHHSVIVHNVALRLDKTHCSDLVEYLSYIERHPEERSFLISALTIHTTSWFREPGAFDQLEQLLKKKWSTAQGITFRLLSIACSTGEEIYSFALYLEQFKKTHPDFLYHIDAWDIDPISLRNAREAIYQSEPFNHAALLFRHHPLPFSTHGATFEIPDAIKNQCAFQAVNILKPPQESGTYDFIACRNMLIYFDPPKIDKVIRFILSKIKPDGVVCLGVSEVGAMAGQKTEALGHGCFKLKKKASTSTVTSTPEKTKTQVVKTNASLSKKILVVEDEELLNELMCDSLRSSGFEVLSAHNYNSARDQIEKHAIGLVLSDFSMSPGKSGLDLCKDLKQDGFTGRFVLISAFADQHLAHEGLKHGCENVILKPCSDRELIALASKLHTPAPMKAEEHRSLPEVILFGASTGGTELLPRLLNHFPKNAPPLMVVQHINSVFAVDFANRLAQTSGLKLSSMRNGEILTRGTLYVALGDYHIGVRKSGGQLKLIVSDDPPVSTLRPSVDYLFESAADIDVKSLAVLLTGMGHDGAFGLLALRDQGNETIAQEETSCRIFGMPKEAIKLGAAEHILNPEQIRELLEKRIGANS